MNLSIEQLAKATKLSVSTVRVYASQRNLGRKVKGKRVFSDADIKKLLKGPRGKSLAKETAKPRSSKVSASRKPGGSKDHTATSPKPTTTTSGSAQPALKRGKTSFWTRLFGARKPQKKVALADVKANR